MWGNPSSSYRKGGEAKHALEAARESVANLLGASPGNVLFTSGATESINSAIRSVLASAPAKKHIITTSVEHSAVFAYCDHLEAVEGYEITRLSVDRSGQIDLSEFERAFRSDTALVSIIWANNETGVLLPIRSYTQICNSLDVPIHVDAVQAVGKIDIDFENCGADFLSLSAHKIGGVKGSGALLIRSPQNFKPFLFGGGQEGGLRGGTESVPLCVAFGAVADICLNDHRNVWEHVAMLRDAFEKQLADEIPHVVFHGKQAERLPNTTSIHLPGIDSDAAVTYLDQRGICVSSGSACLGNAISPSHVIYAMTQSHEVASETIRVSLGRNSTADELRKLVEELKRFIELAG